MKNVRIVTIGGGTGSPIVLKALAIAGIKDITAVSASLDSGGRTGQMRMDERGGVISISDWLRNVMGLISPTDNHLIPVDTLLRQFAFTDGRGRNLGYLYSYLNLERLNNDYDKFQQELESILGIELNGRAYPVSDDPSTLCFETSLGDQFRGEHLLDKYSTADVKINKVWLDPMVKATSYALDAIQNATHIIYSPGSLYGSIISCFLPNGVKSSLQKSQSKKILISNLISQKLESDNFRPINYSELLKRYTGCNQSIDTLVVPNLNRSQFEKKYPFISKRYWKMTGSHFMGWNESEFDEVKAKNIKVVKEPLFNVNPGDKIIRHDSKMLAKVLKKVIY